MKTQSWHTITLQQYIDVIDVVSSDADAIDKHIDTVAIIYGMKREDIESLTIEEFQKYDISFLGQDIGDVKYPFEVIIDDKKYNVVQLIKDLTMAQFVDMQIALSKLVDGKVHKVMKDIVRCFLLDSNSGKYAYDVDVSNMRYIDAYAIMLFFSKFRMKLELTIHRYLTKKEMEMARELTRR